MITQQRQEEELHEEDAVERCTEYNKDISAISENVEYQNSADNVHYKCGSCNDHEDGISNITEKLCSSVIPTNYLEYSNQIFKSQHSDVMSVHVMSSHMSDMVPNCTLSPSNVIINEHDVPQIAGTTECGTNAQLTTEEESRQDMPTCRSEEDTTNSCTGEFIWGTDMNDEDDEEEDEEEDDKFKKLDNIVMKGVQRKKLSESADNKCLRDRFLRVISIWVGLWGCGDGLKKLGGTLIVRTQWTLILISGFFVILAAGHVYCGALVLGLVGCIYGEIISLTRIREKDKKLPWFFALRWYWFCVTIAGIGIPWVGARLEDRFPILDMLLEFHSIMVYGASMGGLIFFILSLRRFSLRYQFSQLGLMLCTLLYVVGQSLMMVANIYWGMIWFFLPASLVIVNDVAAYICGALFGRRKLFRLSPRKTVEGFVGASFATLAWSVFAAAELSQYSVFICPQPQLIFTPFHLWFEPLECTPSPVFRSHVVLPLFPFIQQVTGLSSIKCPSLLIHSLALGAFAAFFAPFGGFFASGFKRTLRIKDFGQSIPGHGGFADRFDCQILMAMFTHLYLKTFVFGTIHNYQKHELKNIHLDHKLHVHPNTSTSTVDTLLEAFINLRPDQQFLLIQKLKFLPNITSLLCHV